MKKVYLAGPSVFFPNADYISKNMKSICLSYDFEGLYPLDNKLSLEGLSKTQQGQLIAKSNIDLIKQSDAIIADITPFRGISADAGTVFEIGFAKALGKPVVAYTTCHVENYFERVNKDVRFQNPLNIFVDLQGNNIEDFDMIENLMVSGLVDKYTPYGYEGAIQELFDIIKNINK